MFMKTKLSRFFFVFGSAVLLVMAAWMYAIMDFGTPDEFSKEAWPKTKESAELATIEHFKKEKNVDVVINEISYSGEYATPEIYIEGYVTGNEQKKISATVNSSENYQVEITSEN